MNDYLSFNKEESIVLFSLEKHLLKVDFQNENNINKKILKNVWMNNWEKGIINFLKIQSNNQPITLINDYNDIINVIANINLKDYKKRIILLELFLFNPYYPLNENNKKEIKNIRFNRKISENEINKIIEYFKFEDKEITTIKDIYKESYNFYADITEKIPFNTSISMKINSLFTSEELESFKNIIKALKETELTQASAMNSILATLGSGYLSYCDLELGVGDINVFVSGGGILGYNSKVNGGNIALDLLKNLSLFTTNQIIKLECAIRYVFLINEDDNSILKEIMESVKGTYDILIEEATNIQTNLSEMKSENDKKDIKKIEKQLFETEKSIKLLQKFINKNECLVTK